MFESSITVKGQTTLPKAVRGFAGSEGRGQRCATSYLTRECSWCLCDPPAAYSAA